MTDDRRARLVTGCHVLASQGQDHFQFGHVSAREADGSDRFWLKTAGIGLGEVDEAALVLLDLDGRRHDGEGGIHQEMHIHAELYRRRPDVGAVIHTHPFHAAALVASTGGFQLVSQDSLAFGTPAWFDDPRLVVDPARGRAVAEALGDGSVVLLRHHGIVVAGADVEVAVGIAVQLERSIALQLAAATLGGVRPMGADEAGELAAQLGSRDDRARAIFRWLARQPGSGRRDA